MAKFAIALCILLVACTGSRGAFTSDILAAYEAKVDELKVAIATKITEFQTLFENAIAAAGNYVADITAKAEEISAQAEAKKQELVEKYGTLNSCVTSSFGTTNLVDEFKTNAVTCVNNRLNTVKFSYDTLHATFETLTSDAIAIINSAQACVAEGTNVLLCVLQEDYAGLKDKFDAVVSSGVTLASELTTITDSLKACAGDSALETLNTAVEEYLRSVEQCLADGQSLE